MFLMMNRILKRLNSPRKALFFIGAFILICALFFTLGSLIYGKIHPTKYINSAGNVLEVRVPYIVNGEIDETVVEIPRGTKVQIEEVEEDQSSFRYEGTLITLDNSYLKDSVYGVAVTLSVTFSVFIPKYSLIISLTAFPA